MTPVVEATGVRVRYGRMTAVDGADIAIFPGETLGLVGESGSGKTTLAKALIGLVPAEAGTIRIDGQPIDRLDRAARLRLRRYAQITLQDAAASLSPRFTVRRLIDEPLRIHGLEPAAERPRVAALLQALGLGESLMDKYPHELSGGQAKRVGIARALVLEPGLLVADEPTAGLDVSVQGEILNLLADLKERFGLALLLVSHNLPVIRRVTDRVAVMYLGRIVEIGPAAVLFRRPAHPYLAALIASTPAIDAGRLTPGVPLAGEIPSPFDPPSGCRFHPRCPEAQDICRRISPDLLPVESLTVESPAVGAGVRDQERLAACHFPLDAPARPPEGGA